MLDLIIKNGSCYINGELKNQNIGIKDCKIVEIGKIETDSINILDAKNLTVLFLFDEISLEQFFSVLEALS